MALHKFTSDLGLTATVVLCSDSRFEKGLHLEMKIGSGMSGHVFRAHFRGRGHRKCAAKVFDRMVEEREGVDNSKCFLREVSILQAVKHRHVISAIMALECPRFRAICTPYYPGGSLKVRLETLPITSAWTFFKQIATAVHHLHRRGIAHRDIKPDNVLISDQGEAILIDLGMAKMTNGLSTSVAGTDGYKAPELGKARTVDLFKCDAYSLGATLWTMVFQEHRPLRRIDCIHCLYYKHLPTLYRILFHRLCHHVVEERWSVCDLVYKSSVDRELSRNFAGTEWN